jgi:hypothetical protein
MISPDGALRTIRDLNFEHKRLTRSVSLKATSPKRLAPLMKPITDPRDVSLHSKGNIVNPILLRLQP